MSSATILLIALWVIIGKHKIEHYYMDVPDLRLV